MFSSGADIDIKRLEEEIRKEIDEKRKRLFSDEELDELQKLELNIIANPDRIRPFFHKELEFERPDLKLPEHFESPDYNIDLNTFLYSSRGGLLSKLRNWMKPFFRLHGNIDALIYKQAQFNREQVEFNSYLLERIGKLLEKPFHYIRVLHTLVNYLVTELTKLNLQHQLLKSKVDALAYDLDQLRKRERLLEKMVVLKEK
jgi:hypothetical protein